MLKRELLRIAVLAGAGFLLALLFSPSQILLLLAPLYLVGVFYAGRTLLGLVGGLFRSWGQWQMITLFSHSLTGGLLCLIFLVLGLAFIAAVGWMIGIIRCFMALYNAAQIDQQLKLP